MTHQIPRPELHTTDAEISVESLMAELGRQRYRGGAEAARKFGRSSETATGKYLLREAVSKVAVAVGEYMKVAASRAGRGHYISGRFANIGADVLAFLAVKSVLDSVGKNATLTSAAYSLGNRIEEEEKFLLIHRQEPVMMKDLKRRLLRSRVTQKRRAMLASALEKIQATHEPWPKADKIRAGVVLIELVKDHTGLVEIQLLASANTVRRKAYVTATPETLAWIEKSHQAHESLFPFYMPTLVPPLDWVDDPWTGGYHTNLVLRRPVVKTRDRDYLDDVAANPLTEVYGAVNALQATPWEVNRDVYETMKFFWEAGTPIADLPERMDAPRPSSPQGADKDSEESKAYRKARAAWHAAVVANRSHRVMAAKTMFMAERYLDKRFYFPYQADFRGRLYPVPYFLQPQGPSQARGLLRFANGRAITDRRGASYLAVHGANMFGVDKVSFDDRIAWVTENEAKILLVHEDPIENRWWAQAKKPWEFLAWCLEWAQYLEEGLGFVSKIPVSMDGTNNGLQIFSLLMRDELGAAATNVIASKGDDGKTTVRDIYQDVADTVTLKLRALADTGDENAAIWVRFLGPEGLPRAATKRSVMTLPYGSTFHSCIHYVREWYEAEWPKRGARPFERGYDSSVYLARLVWAAIDEVVVAARACMGWLRDVAGLLSKHDLPVRWTSPSGFPVKQGYMKYLSKSIQTVIGERVRDTRYRIDTDEVSMKKQKNGVSPNFVHSLDAAALVKTVLGARDRGITDFMMVHDSYGVPAQDAGTMSEVLREVYADMFRENLLERFRDEVQAYAPEGVTIPAELAVPAPPATRSEG